jgi:hypothetical protein
VTETQIKSDIQKALDKLGIPHWRMQAGGYRGRTHGLPKGTPDILAAPQCMGRPLFLWIEVKRPGKEATTEQWDFRNRMTVRGHYWIKATCARDVLKWLDESL